MMRSGQPVKYFLGTTCEAGQARRVWNKLALRNSVNRMLLIRRKRIGFGFSPAAEFGSESGNRSRAKRRGTQRVRRIGKIGWAYSGPSKWSSVHAYDRPANRDHRLAVLLSG